MRFALIFSLFALPALADTTADIVILGEVHDNPDAHLGQAAAVAALAPKAVVFEMLLPQEAARADADRSQTAAAWEASNWSDYPIYEPIFEALGQARIIGAAAPRDTIRSISSEGPEAVFGPDADRFGLDQPLPEEQQTAREALQFEAHCEAVPIEAMPAMVSVQRFRDAAFARAAIEALETHGAPVVVITGNGHARTDWGVPAMIAQAAPEVTVHSIAFLEEPTDIPFDETRIVARTERPDPCDAFKKN